VVRRVKMERRERRWRMGVGVRASEKGERVKE
jgi:hypothetical protein